MPVIDGSFVSGANICLKEMCGAGETVMLSNCYMNISYGYYASLRVTNFKLVL